MLALALNFFISYSSEVIEPLWSFNQYFDFILVLFITTGLAFQVPIAQIILGLFGIISGSIKMVFTIVNARLWYGMLKKFENLII